MKSSTARLAFALAAALPFSATAGIWGGSKPPSDELLRKRAADAIGYEPDEITVSDVTKEDINVTFKARLADGTTYRCTTETFSRFVSIMSMGADQTSAECVKRPGSGKGPEARKSPLQKLRDEARR